MNMLMEFVERDDECSKAAAFYATVPGLIISSFQYVFKNILLYTSGMSDDKDFCRARSYCLDFSSCGLHACTEIKRFRPRFPVVVKISSSNM